MLACGVGCLTGISLEIIQLSAVDQSPAMAHHGRLAPLDRIDHALRVGDEHAVSADHIIAAAVIRVIKRVWMPCSFSKGGAIFFQGNPFGGADRGGAANPRRAKAQDRDLDGGGHADQKT